MIITKSLTLLALGTLALGATPAPDDAQTVTVFSENANNSVTLDTNPTSERLGSFHTHDTLQLASPTPVSGTWGERWHVVLPDGRTGYIATNAAILTPTTTLDDLTQESVVVAPSAGGGWLGQLAAGSSTAFAYPTTQADKIAVPAVGDMLDCAPGEVTAKAGLLGDVPMTPCEVNGQVGYIRSEHVAPMPDVSAIEFTSTQTAVADTPVYGAPAATSETVPLATIAAGTKVEVGKPTGAFTPVRYDGQVAWAPTNVLMGIESWTDKAKDKASEVWGKTKEVASDAKDAVVEKVENTEISTPTVVSQVRDVPGLIVSGVLAPITLAMAWIRKVGIFKLPRLVRRALNMLAVVPLLALAAAAPIASYAWMLWVVLGVTAAVAAGVLSGFKPDLTRAAEVARTRKAQVVAGAVVVGGALIGAAVTGFTGWLAPLSAAIVSLAAAAGYLLSAPEKDTDATPAAPEGETPVEVEEVAP